MIDLTPIAIAVITVICTIITCVIVPWIESKTSVQQRENMLRWIEIGVAAAQQLYYAADGTKRKEYVLKFLADKGYDIHTKDIDNAIEAAVLKLHQQLVD